MSVNKLFDVQRRLDQRIVRNKDWEHEQYFSMKVLSFLVELGECANEWQLFKFWKEYPKSNTRKQVRNCDTCFGSGVLVKKRVNGLPIHQKCSDCSGKGGHFKNPMLEEYVDCLHFILSIGLEMGRDKTIATFPAVGNRSNSLVVNRFNDCFTYGTALLDDDFYDSLFQHFMDLGYLLGFTWDQVESAYYEKNSTNHERQDNGY